MKEKQNTSTKPSEPDKVDAYMQKLKHPLAEVVEALRRIILSTDTEVGEEIKWNAPPFFYTGAMKPFNPKEYKRSENAPGLEGHKTYPTRGKNLGWGPQLCPV